MCCLLIKNVGYDSSVGTATRYGLGGTGIESRWGRDRPCGPPSLLHNGYRVSFLWVKRSGLGGNHQPSSGAEVKARVEICLFPLWAYMACYEKAESSHLIILHTLSRYVVVYLCISRKIKKKKIIFGVPTGKVI